MLLLLSCLPLTAHADISKIGLLFFFFFFLNTLNRNVTKCNVKGMNLPWCITVRNALEKLILRKLFEYFIASMGKSPGEGQILVHTPGAFRSGCVPCPASTSLGCASESPGFVSSDEDPPGKDIKTGKVKPMMCQEIPGPFSWRPIWLDTGRRKIWKGFTSTSFPSQHSYSSSTLPPPWERDAEYVPAWSTYFNRAFLSEICSQTF